MISRNDSGYQAENNGKGFVWKRQESSMNNQDETMKARQGNT